MDNLEKPQEVLEGELFAQEDQNNDIYNSYIFTTSNRATTIYGERLLMSVIAVAKDYIMDVALKQNKLNFSEVYKEKFATIEIPIRTLLNSTDSTNYRAAKAAAEALMSIHHSVEVPVVNDKGEQVMNSDGTPMYKFSAYQLLNSIRINEKPGTVIVELGANTWKQILDMGKGYTKYNLLTARSLSTVPAIRLYQLMCNTTEPVCFTIERLKAIFGVKDAYENRPSMFVRRIIEAAEKEINKSCSFRVYHTPIYTKATESVGGRPVIYGLKIYKETAGQQSSRSISRIDHETLDTLKRVFSFTDTEIKNNINLFIQSEKAGIDFKAFLTRISDNALSSPSPKAYVIKSLQNELKTVSASRGLPTDTADSPERKKGRPKKDQSDSAGMDLFKNNDFEEL